MKDFDEFRGRVKRAIEEDDEAFLVAFGIAAGTIWFVIGIICLIMVLIVLFT